MVDFMNTDGTFGDMSTAPEAVRTLVENKGFKNVEDIVQMTTNLESMKGAWADPAAMKLPDELSPENLITIHGKLGVPESRDGYVYEAPDGKEILAKDTLDKFTDFASEKNFSKDQFSGSVDFYNDILTQAEAALTESETKAFTEATATLKTKWDTDFEANAEAADAFNVKSGLSELWELFPGSENHPKVVEKMFELSKLMEEGTLPNADPVPAKTNEQRLGELTSDPAYTNAMHPDHKKIIAEVNKIHGIAG